MYKHIAYNIETGEVITASTGNHLKRCVARANAWSVRFGFSTGKWLFAHTKEGERRLATKVANSLSK